MVRGQCEPIESTSRCIVTDMRECRGTLEAEGVRCSGRNIDGDTEGIEDVQLPSSPRIIEGFERVARIGRHRKASEVRCILSLRIRRFRLRSYEL